MRLGAFLSLGVLLACLSVTFSTPVYDEILAARRIWESSKEFTPSVYGAPLVDNDRAILRELDIVEPIPCVMTTGEADLEKTFDLQTSPVRVCQEDEVTTRSKRNIAVYARHWGTLQIPYQIDLRYFSPAEQANINAAFAEYQRYTCVSFYPSNWRTPRINIVRKKGCSSAIGNVGPIQELSLGHGCADSKATPIHELFHALGSHHQQNRPDRDRYVQINRGNIERGMEHNFDKLTSAYLYNTAYNYRSVMHYPAHAFSVNRWPTIQAKWPYQGVHMGDAPTFSFEDLQLLNRRYGCDRGCRWQNPCGPNQYRGKDCRCYCKNPRSLDPPVYACLPHSSPTGLKQKNATLCTKDKCKNIAGTVCDKDTGACINISECTSPQTPCQCYKEERPCARVQNSHCEKDTGMCVCDKNYYKWERNGKSKCRKAPKCKTLGKQCECTVQGPNACKRIPGSQCDENSNACVCLPHMTPNSNKTSCIAKNHPLFINDGSSISPFISDVEQSKQFSVVEASEPSSTLGITRNERALHVNGMTDSEQAVLIVPPLTDDDSLEDIKLCVDYNENNLDAVLYVKSRASTTSSWQEFGFPPQNDLKAGGTLRKLTFKVPKSSTFEMQMAARPYNLGSNNYWEVNVDPVLIYRCD